jgi:hypothetical protein
MLNSISENKSSQEQIPMAKNGGKNKDTEYLKWKSKLPKNLQYEGDYDLRGFYNENPNFNPSDPNQHLTDKFKLPNHPTFSNESKYFNMVQPQILNQAGHWDKTDSSYNYIPYNTMYKDTIIEKFKNGGSIKKYPNGGREPIVVNDPRDERLHSYLDSLNLYNSYQTQLKYNPPQDVNKSLAAKYLKPGTEAYNNNVNARQIFNKNSPAKNAKYFKNVTSDYWNSEAQFKKDVPEDAPLMMLIKNYLFQLLPKQVYGQLLIYIIVVLRLLIFILVDKNLKVVHGILFTKNQFNHMHTQEIQQIMNNIEALLQLWEQIEYLNL